MRIVHIAISCFYIEGWGYQENLLPKYHKKAGHDVYMISSRFDKDEYNQPKLRPVSNYINKDGIKVCILDYDKKTFLQKLLRLQPIKGFYEKLNTIHPDIIFVHGGASCISLEVVRYKRNHPSIRVFADQHADYYNTPIDTLKKKLLARYLSGFFVRLLAKYTERYWGVTPWRVDYLQKVYGLSPRKTDLLVMGADDELIDYEHRDEIRLQYRTSLNINLSSFLLVTGGKVDQTKNIQYLLKAVNVLPYDITIVVFGTIGEDISEEINELVKDKSNVHLVGWLNNRQIINSFLAADLVAFPGTHSVLWEQCVACGAPMIVKNWEGMHHVDIGGNCKFIEGSNVIELRNTIEEIVSDTEVYSAMLTAATSDKRKNFLYSKIAKRSICDD